MLYSYVTRKRKRFSGTEYILWKIQLKENNKMNMQVLISQLNKNFYSIIEIQMCSISSPSHRKMHSEILYWPINPLLLFVDSNICLYFLKNRERFSVPESYINRVKMHIFFHGCYFGSILCCWNLFTLKHIALIYLFSLLASIVLYKYTNIYLSVLLLSKYRFFPFVWYYEWWRYEHLCMYVLMNFLKSILEYIPVKLLAKL